MKLRFHDNSLRLRLSQSEVARLRDAGRVEDTVTFAPGQALVYSIERGAAPAVTAAFENGRIRVTVPEAAAREWTDSDHVSVEGSTPTLHILIEKDFQCLHRSSEEDRDAFPNPLAQG
jgi:hypothetical protein